MKFSIVTPTYNRAYLLPKLYESLLHQTYTDFEWIVVDDCSIDNTFELVNDWVKNSPFCIKYYRCSSNGGKHRAINVALDNSLGDLFFIVDSDDVLPYDSLNIIKCVVESIPSNCKASFCGVCGLKSNFKREVVGSTFKDDKYLDITQLERDVQGIKGDKAEVFFTNIIKKYKFPTFDNENFCTEALVWDRMAYDGYKLRFFNEIIYLCEYLEDGLSYRYHELCKNNPRGYGLYIYQSIMFGKIDKDRKWREIYNYYKDHKDELRPLVIAKYLHINIFIFIFGINIYRIKKNLFHLKKRIRR